MALGQYSRLRCARMPPADEKFTPFMTALCLGRIEEDLILPYPKTAAKDVELLKNVLSSIDQVLKPHEKNFRKWDRDGEFPPGFADELKQFGLFSLVVPEAYGGMAMNATSYSRPLQEIAKYDGSVAVTVGAHSS